MAAADPNRVVRQLPLVVGILGGSLLMINRAIAPDVSPVQSRSDAIGIILSAILILTGLLWQQIQARLPESVELHGTQQFDLLETLSPAVKTELAWASHLLLTNTATRSLLVWYDGQILLRRGMLPPGGPPDGLLSGHASPQIEPAMATQPTTLTPGPILTRVMQKQQPVYLVALKLYPGRVEFNYLPDNTQGVICQPIGSRGALILGANAPRSYTQQDENWIAAIADKLDNSLNSDSLNSRLS